MYGITSKFVGYNKRQVDDHLKNTQQFYENELSSIRESINEYRQERNYLIQELESLQLNREKYANSVQLMQFALERVNNTIKLMDMTAREDIQAILTDSENRISIHEKYLADVEEEIKKTKKQLNQLLQNIMQTINVPNNHSENEDYSTAGKIVGKIIAFTGKSESSLAIPDSNNIEKKNSVKQENIESPVMLAQMTADGSVVPKPRNIAELVTNTMESDNSVDVNENSSLFGNTEMVHAVETSPVEDPGGFWESPDEYVTAGSASDIISQQVNPDGAEAPGVKTKNNHNPEKNLPGADGPVGWQDKPSGDILIAGFETASSVDLSPGPVFSNSDDNQKSDYFSANGEEPSPGDQAKVRDFSLKASPAVEKEIKTIRHKYVVGKLAGEDLVDNSGRLIIGKKGLITTEVVEVAEKEGKLAELIVHMIIPGLEE